jgi:hypothetical protein
MSDDRAVIVNEIAVAIYRVKNLLASAEHFSVTRIADLLTALPNWSEMLAHGITPQFAQSQCR